MYLIRNNCIRNEQNISISIKCIKSLILMAYNYHRGYLNYFSFKIVTKIKNNKLIYKKYQVNVGKLLY